ncbi:hypothetical protein AK812_SmicGene14074 [Symbiodinium microadriaticum]|uniref:Uncharacterized protein n=1 Tax=Symbiodinium microadriaticum TaxID=2951 RepID=A0A1Q9E6I0_SYMMI|nr:hypothetical protein AK812_SmicGene14074 [Symbiodinium microadriaticum]
MVAATSAHSAFVTWGSTILWALTSIRHSLFGRAHLQVRVIGQQPSKIYAINRDHLESPDDDTPRPRVQDDGLLGPRLRWRLYPPPLTLFTAPVLLGWRHLPQADSFFWRRDVEDSALAKYSGGDSIAAHSDVRVDDATQSPDSFEDVLVEEPGPDAEAVTPMPEEEHGQLPPHAAAVAAVAALL